MFRKAFIALSFAGIMSASAFAQAQPVDDYKKAEFYVGYSNGQIDSGVDSGSTADIFRDRTSFNGVNAQGVYNLTRYLGVKGDFSATFNNKRFSGEASTGGIPFQIEFDTKNSLYNAVGGIQVKDNSNSGRFKPFAHAMVGVGHARTEFGSSTCTSTGGACADVVLPTGKFSDTGFSAVVGGGVDFRVNNRFQIRAIQVDYNPVRIGDTTTNNIRLGAGIVF